MAQSINQLSVKIYSYLHELYELRKWSLVWISTSVMKGENHAIVVVMPLL